MLERWVVPAHLKDRTPAEKGCLDPKASDQTSQIATTRLRAQPEGMREA